MIECFLCGPAPLREYRYPLFPVKKSLQYDTAAATMLIYPLD
jgi:hypothetical protein